MVYLVTITSQGQISIPAKIRRELGFNKNMRAVVRKQGSKVIIEPVDEILSFKGALKKYALKGKSIDEIRKLEKEAWEKGAVERYLKTL